MMWNMNYASDKQINFIASLSEQVGGDTYHAVCAELLVPKDPSEVPSRDASRLIDALLEARASKPRPAPKPEAHDVPAGRYALAGDDGALAFYKIDRPEQGKWAGYTFVKQIAGDNEYPVKGARKAAILAEVAADPAAASAAYGHNIGACGVCGRTLTDEVSRANGIGPVCAEKMGW